MRHRTLPPRNKASTISAQPLRTGRVVRAHGSQATIESDDGKLIECKVRRTLGRVVCGDAIEWQSEGKDTGAVVSVHLRRNLLQRDPDSGRPKPLAANIDRLIIVTSAHPPPDIEGLDHYLVAAETLDADAVIVFNKVDLLDAEQANAHAAWIDDYTRIGYPVILASATHQQGIAELLAMLKGGVGVLVGQSGVGKSSLLQLLLPDTDISVGEVSAGTGHGRHTTSVATLYQLPGGGALIDSPGVRGFTPSALSANELAHGFREIRELLGQCRFQDCRHSGEPGCAVEAAGKTGGISARRLESYRKMLAGIA